MNGYTFLTKEKCEEANRAASFLPQTTEDEKPCLVVAGVLVFAYLHETNRVFRVSVDLDTVDEEFVPDDAPVPIEIRLQGTVVFASSASGQVVVQRPSLDHSISLDFPTEEECERANRAAAFLPQKAEEGRACIEEEERPCLVVAGVPVFAYLHEESGTLRVSVEPETAVPIEVSIQGTIVFTSGRAV